MLNVVTRRRKPPKNEEHDYRVGGALVTFVLGTFLALGVVMLIIWYVSS